MANRQQTYHSIEKMLASLDDPFTRFLDPTKYSALKGGTRGISILLFYLRFGLGVVTGVGLEVAYSESEKSPELRAINQTSRRRDLVLVLRWLLLPLMALHLSRDNFWRRSPGDRWKLGLQ